MKGSIVTIAIALAAAAGPALAQEGDVGIIDPTYTQSESEVSTSPVKRTPPGAPSNAWEIGLGFGYSQGVGDIGGNSPTLTDLTHGGGEVQLSLGYRINPNWLVGIYGTGGKYSLGNLTPSDSDVWSATAGVQGGARRGLARALDQQAGRDRFPARARPRSPAGRGRLPGEPGIQRLPIRRGERDRVPHPVALAAERLFQRTGSERELLLRRRPDGTVRHPRVEVGGGPGGEQLKPLRLA